jgi:hypothetical protein
MVALMGIDKAMKKCEAIYSIDYTRLASKAVAYL